MSDISAMQVFTLNESRDIFLKPAITDPSVLQLMTVYTNLTHRQKLHTVDSVKDILRLAPACGMTVNNNVQLNSTYIDPKNLGFFEGFCESDIDGTIYSIDANSGTERMNLQGKLISDVINKLFVDALMRNIPKLAFWGNTGNPNDKFNAFDGFLTKAINAINQGVAPLAFSTGSGSALSANQGLSILKGVYSNAKMQLKSLAYQGYAKMFVTQSIFQNLEETLEASSLLTSPSGLTKKADGTLWYKSNIEVVMMATWDDALANGDATGTPAPYSHWCFFTSPKNLVLGTDLANPLATNLFKSWYEEKDEMNYIKGRMRMDAGIVFPEFISLGK
jgi:hypothetical protein